MRWHAKPAWPPLCLSKFLCIGCCVAAGPVERNTGRVVTLQNPAAMRRHILSSRERGNSPKHSCRHQMSEETDLETAWPASLGCKGLEVRDPSEGARASEHNQNRLQNGRGKDCRRKENAVQYHPAAFDALKRTERCNSDFSSGIFLARAAGHAAGANWLARVSWNTGQ